MNKVPRSSFTYLVEDYFAKNQSSMRNQVLGRYHGFFHGLLKSPSQEVRLLCNMVARDPSSNTADNLSYIKEQSRLSIWKNSSVEIKHALPVRKPPECEQWRLGLLGSLLDMRDQQHLLAADSRRLSSMIDSLCST